MLPLQQTSCSPVLNGWMLILWGNFLYGALFSLPDGRRWAPPPPEAAQRRETRPCPWGGHTWPQGISVPAGWAVNCAGHRPVGRAGEPGRRGRQGDVVRGASCRRQQQGLEQRRGDGQENAGRPEARCPGRGLDVFSVGPPRETPQAPPRVTRPTETQGPGWLCVPAGGCHLAGRKDQPGAWGGGW